MIYLEIALLIGCIFYAAKLGGIGVGMAGGIGMFIAVFLLGLKPGDLPIDVMLIIMTVIFTISVMQKAGGLTYMVKCAENILRKNPRHINILAPVVSFVLSVLGGTGYMAMSILNVIQQVAKENGVLVVILGTSLFGLIVCCLISSYQGCDLSKDPIFQERMAKGLVSMTSKSEKSLPATREAKLSVVIFLLAVCFIVLMLLFKPVIGHTLGSRDIILITMLVAGFLMYKFCGVKLTEIKDAPIFRSGAESLVVVLGIVWVAATIIGAHIPEIREQAVLLIKDYPYLVAVAFFLASSVLFSQGATAALLVPVAASIGVDAPTIVGSIVACSALYITNIYPTTAFAIACDDMGSYMDKKWNGSLVINHPFFLPGCLSLAAVPFGLMLANLDIG